MSGALTRMVWVGVGGAVGSMLRYGLAGIAQRGAVVFPIGTLLVNVIGCLAIGFLSERLTDAVVDPQYRTAILVGVLGGFTTFSTFSLDTMNLVRDREYILASLNVITSVLTCLAAVWCGQRLAKWLVAT